MTAKIVVALCGLPGSGKSALAMDLQRQTGWLRLDRDAVRTELFANGGYEDSDKAILNHAMRERMNALLTEGHSIILDGMTFSRNDERDAFRSEAVAHGARWWLVWLDCPAATAQARVANDDMHVAKDRNPELVLRVAQRFEFPCIASQSEVLRLDARAGPPELRRQLLAELAKRMDVTPL